MEVIVFLILATFPFRVSEARVVESNLKEQDLECIKELNLTKKFVVDGFDQNNLVREGNEQLNDFVACAWKKNHYLTKTGEINVHEIKKELQQYLALPENDNGKSVNVNSLIEHCVKIQGRNSGDTAVKFYNCVTKRVFSL